MLRKIPPRVAPWGRVRGGGRDGGRNPPDVVCGDDFRALRRKVDTLQEELCRRVQHRRREPKSEEDESSDTYIQSSGGKNVAPKLVNDPWLATISRIGKRPKIEVSTFCGNLNLEELI